MPNGPPAPPLQRGQCFPRARKYAGPVARALLAAFAGRDDLLLLAKLADQVHSFIYERGAAQRPEEQA